MKKLLVILSMLFLFACQSNDKTIFDRSISFERATEAMNLKQLLTNEWQTLFFCQGNDYWLDTSFSVSNDGLRVTFDGKPTNATSLLGEAQPMADIFGEYTGQVNEQDGFFVLEPESRRIVLPTFHGIYETENDMLVMSLTGENWNECSSALSVPVSRRGELEDLLLKGDNAVEAMIKDSMPVQVVDNIVDDLVQELAPDAQMKKCDEAMLDWVNRYLKGQPENVFSHLNRAQINEMYEDEGFSAVFGEPLSSFGINDGVMRARLITYPQTCNLPVNPKSPDWEALVRLTYPLANHSAYGRDAVFIDIKAKRLRESWMQLSYVRLLGWSRTPLQNTAVRLQALNELENFLPEIKDDVWPLDIRPLEYQIDNTRQLLKNADFEGY